MPLNRLPDVILSNQTLTGVSADYLDGITSSTLSQSLRANRNLTGGGTITFDASGNLFWSSRFIVISNGRGTHFSVDGYYEINCPTSGTITGVGGQSNKTATSAGIPMTGWDALYVILPIGSGNFVGNFRIASFTADLEVPHDWLLIAIRNGDDGLVYLNNGVILAPGQSQRGDSKSFLRIGTSDTENYITFRGTAGDEPGNYTHTFIGERIYGGSEQSELLLFKGNDNDPSAGPDRIRSIASNHVFQTYTAPVSGSFSTVATSGLNATRMIIKENGQVGIGTTSPDTIASSSTPAMLGIVPNAVGTAGLVVRGIASQVGDLQQWQNSSATVLASINPSGFLSTPRINFTGGTSTVSALALSDGTLSFESTAGQLFSISNSLTGTIFSVNDISGLPIVEATDLGIVKINELYGQTVFGSGTPVANTMLTSIARTATNIPIVVKGAASQTANLQEWQNSAGTVLANVNASGKLSLMLPSGTFGNVLSLGANNTTDLIKIGYASGGVSYIIPSIYGQFQIQLPIATSGFAVKGFASQTANLQEWQDSSGNVLSTIASNGSLRVTNISSTVNTGAYTNHASDSVTILQRVTTAVNLIVKGAASQTANLQEWQNSAGGIIGWFNAYGSFEVANSLNGAKAELGNRGVSQASTLVLKIQGFASQTANLTEWQNSSGTVLAEVTASGGFELNGKDIELMNIMGAF